MIGYKLKSYLKSILKIGMFCLIYFRQIRLCLKTNMSSIFILLFYMPQWFIKNIKGKGTFYDRKPWLTFESIKFLNNNIKKEMTVFEYGTGGSTLYFLDKGCNVISVEHDPEYYKKVSELANCPKWNGLLIEPTIIDFHSYDRETTDKTNLNQGRELNSVTYKSKAKTYENMNFKEYVSSIDQYPDNHFDIILIDGRARNYCLRHSKNKLKKSGYIILDDAERKEYNQGKEEISNTKWKEFIFYGPRPYHKNFSETIIWQRI